MLPMDHEARNDVQPGPTRALAQVDALAPEYGSGATMINSNGTVMILPTPVCDEKQQPLDKIMAIEDGDPRANTATLTLSGPNRVSMAAQPSSPSSPRSSQSKEYDTHCGIVIVPQVGMSFESENDAYDMYNSYARKIGFSIRKSLTRRRADCTIYQKHIVCSNEGKRGSHSSHDTLKENSITRTSCKARVQFSVCRKGIWTVQNVVLRHNHYLASPNKVHKLRSQRSVIEADKVLINQIREAGMKPTQVYDFFKKWYGGVENVPFSRVDCNNQIGSQRKKYLPSYDAQTLLEYLKNKQLEDPAFFWAIELDKEDGQIANY